MPETASFVAPDFLALTIGIVVFFVGVLITQRVAFLRSYNIPEPVTGGFVAALAFWAVYEVFGLAIDFEMVTRDRLLVIFFATVGINARLADLASGGRVLGILCLITVAFVFLQDIVGTFGAVAMGLPASAGVVMGTISLVGGHGTAIAWGPTIAADHGFPAALETGIAVATLGLIVASLLGGPLAKLLIERRGLAPSRRTCRSTSSRRKRTRHRSTRWGSCGRCSRSTWRSSSATSYTTGSRRRPG
jgi:ESS family glutamate:Na+ symporter